MSLTFEEVFEKKLLMYFTKYAIKFEIVYGFNIFNL